MSTIPSLTSMAKSAGCAAKIAQADLTQALAHLPKADDPNLLVDHAGSDDAAVYRLSAEMPLVISMLWVQSRLVPSALLVGRLKY